MRPALLLLAATLALPASASPAADAPPATSTAPAPRLASLTIDAALGLARAHLADAEPAEAAREIVGAHFIPPHGRAGSGFWLVDLAPYPSDRPSPAAAFTSLLIAMDGTIERRGARRPLSPDEQKARDEKAANLQRLMRSSTAP